MSEIFIFLLGGLFIVFVLPLVQGLIDIILVCFEVMRSKMSVVISENNMKINNMSASVQNTDNSCAVGFQIPDEDFFCEDEEDGGME